jgi:chromosome partitioning protein
MWTVAVISQKGGAGKTTLAIHLAVSAQASGLTAAIFDLDPQATAETWGQWREEKPPEVVPAKAATLARAMDKARESIDVLLLDTPGAAEGAALAAAAAADLVLIPCRPRSFDLAAVRQTATLARSTGRPLWLVFNATGARGQVRADARDVAASIGLAVAPVRLAERADFHKATEAGLAAQELNPTGKAAEEAEALWVWASGLLNVSTRGREDKRMPG